jgi:hypothetical protein
MVLLAALMCPYNLENRYLPPEMSLSFPLFSCQPLPGVHLRREGVLGVGLHVLQLVALCDIILRILLQILLLLELLDYILALLTSRLQK